MNTVDSTATNWAEIYGEHVKGLALNVVTMLAELLYFFFHPRILLTHVVAWPLLFDLQRRIEKRRWLRVAILEELLIFVLWLFIPNGWASIIALWICIQVYERVGGPRLTISHDAVLLADEDLKDAFNDVRDVLHLRFKEQESGRLAVNTNLSFTLYPKDATTLKNFEEEGVRLENVILVKDGPDFNARNALAANKFQVDQCFQLRFSMTKSVLTLAAPSADEKRCWLKLFDQLYGQHIGDVKQTWYEQVVLKQLPGIDGNVTLEQCVELLTNETWTTDPAYVKEIVSVIQKEAGTKGSDVVSTEQLRTLVDRTVFRKDIEEIYKRLLDESRGEQVLLPAKFNSFLKTTQKEDISIAESKRIQKSHETVTSHHSMSVMGFTKFLLSEDNTLFNHEYQTKVYQDMNQPLCNYFIACSHNTYLTKDQLRSKSSVDMYSGALKRGCKCLELDCWDGNNNEPVIYHGHTLTSKILFRDVIKTIKEYAFVASSYPVILSFENHCSVEQQKVMAKHLVEIMGDLLYTDPPPEDETTLPSPEKLKGYIIVKNKKLKEGVDETEEEDDEFSDVDEEEVQEMAEQGKLDTEALKEVLQEVSQEAGETASIDSFELENGVSNGQDKPEDSGSLSDSPDEKSHGRRSISSLMKHVKSAKKQISKLSSSTSSLAGSSSSSSSKKKKGPKLASELSDLIAYCQAVSFKGFSYAKNNLRHYEMSSFGEKRAFKLSKEQTTEFLDYNRKHMSRTYPAGGRVDSSNYEPTPLWNIGCQLVALNYQTGTLPMQINQAQFADNGGCGYVLKPELLRNDESKYDPRGPFDEKRGINLKLKIISGSQLPHKSDKDTKKEKDVFVLVRVLGTEEDQHKLKSRAVRSKGFICLWEEEWTIRILVPELAFISLAVMEGSSFLGHSTFPVRAMQPGIRWTPLQDKMSNTLPHASLLVENSIQLAHA